MQNFSFRIYNIHPMRLHEQVYHIYFYLFTITEANETVVCENRNFFSKNPRSHFKKCDLESQIPSLRSQSEIMT